MKLCQDETLLVAHSKPHGLESGADYDIADQEMLKQEGMTSVSLNRSSILK